MDDDDDGPNAEEMDVVERETVAAALDSSLGSEIGCSPIKIQKLATEDVKYIERKVMKVYHELRQKLYDIAGMPCPVIPNSDIINVTDYGRLVYE